uniref:Uncharacterized protein n=1 Tax=Timema douglasi TaxID=61478 RepID=A0A7R8VQ83_TIMDO|nr:unnamed protein product [Timema douglasi]
MAIHSGESCSRPYSLVSLVSTLLAVLSQLYSLVSLVSTVLAGLVSLVTAILAGSSERQVLVSLEDFRSVLDDLVPSVNDEDLEYFPTVASSVGGQPQSALHALSVVICSNRMKPRSGDWAVEIDFLQGANPPRWRSWPTALVVLSSTTEDGEIEVRISVG